jgi:glycosyltransferase involved in cell wall biosynthesis
MLPDLTYGIPAYNEEGNILQCLESIDQQDIDARVETLVCLNGCTDKTADDVAEGIRRYPGLNIRVMHSGKGKVLAQNQIAHSVNNREVPLAFVDADTILDGKCMEILYDDIGAIDNLIVAGAWPVPLKPDNMSFWERFLYRTLHARALNPEAEVTVHDTSAYKSFADSRPQPTIKPEVEKRLKIYFHGRAFMIRNPDFFELPEEENVADDTFLPNHLHTKYGPGIIRIRYDAKAYYKPYLSLCQHFNTYWRIWSDLADIDKAGKFKESRRMEETRLDWDFIRSQGLGTTLDFMTYRAISAAEEAVYRARPRRSLADIWHYHKK